MESAGMGRTCIIIAAQSGQPYPNQVLLLLPNEQCTVADDRSATRSPEPDMLFREFAKAHVGIRGEGKEGQAMLPVDRRPMRATLNHQLLQSPRSMCLRTQYHDYGVPRTASLFPLLLRFSERPDEAGNFRGGQFGVLIVFPGFMGLTTDACRGGHVRVPKDPLHSYPTPR